MNPKDWRKERDISLADMGARIKKTAVSVMRYENGERFPEPETISAYVAATDGAVGYDDFVAIRNAVASAGERGAA